MTPSRMAACFSIFLFVFSASGQGKIRVWPSELDFGTRTERQTDSLALYLSNANSIPVYARLRIPFQTYRSQPFRVKDSLIGLPPGSTKAVWVYCRIRHNVANSAAVLIQTARFPNPFEEGSDGPWCSVALRCQGRFSMPYYSITENLSEEALKQALKSRLAQNYTGFSYDVARDKMYGSIDNRNDSVTCIYTNRKAKFNSRSGAASNNFNCEHTFPQGFFGQDLPMRSDIHHLFSTDENANNSRGNLPFGVATAPFTDVAINAPSRRGGGVYEPQDSHKGATARAMMYFVTRYQDYSNFYGSQDSIFRVWNRTYAPARKDSLRNEAIFGEQNNRNPYIDYPQLEERIRSFTSTSVAVSRAKIELRTPQIDVAGGLSSPDSIQGILWNGGNEAVTILNLRVVSPNPCPQPFPLPSNFLLEANSARTFLIRSCSDQDSVKFETNSALFPSVSARIGYLISAVSRPSNADFSVRIFPHPLTNDGGTLLFTRPIEGEGKLVVRDCLGRLVWEHRLSAGTTKQEVSRGTFSSGVYRIHITDGRGTASSPFILP